MAAKVATESFLQVLQNRRTYYALSKNLGSVTPARVQELGLGANLQHYNPIIDDKVAAQWSLPATWKLNAQLVFGGKAGEAGPKEFKPLEERVKVFGA
ncbi:unnamed protein product [Clonostachys rosea f. rosea IK726]|uniref:Nitroreductase domain-containing protein n=2 Tax=Bionectria ochroleuca TaxID=29856 RepID=A0A0B7JVY0_BIOOC|nr:unnamed protein product [Clonostachys rosea f. rosea IK726]